MRDEMRSLARRIRVVFFFSQLMIPFHSTPCHSVNSIHPHYLYVIHSLGNHSFLFLSPKYV